MGPQYDTYVNGVYICTWRVEVSMNGWGSVVESLTPMTSGSIFKSSQRKCTSNPKQSKYPRTVEFLVEGYGHG
jgi:hypothetical protein